MYSYFGSFTLLPLILIANKRLMVLVDVDREKVPLEVMETKVSQVCLVDLV